MLACRPSLTELICASPLCQEPHVLTLAVSAVKWRARNDGGAPAPASWEPCYDTRLDTSVHNSKGPGMDDAARDRLVRAGAVLAAPRHRPIPLAGHPGSHAGHPDL